MSAKSIAAALVKTTGIHLSTTRINESEMGPERLAHRDAYVAHAQQAEYHRRQAEHITGHLASFHNAFQSDVRPMLSAEPAVSKIAHDHVATKNQVADALMDDKSQRLHKAAHTASGQMHAAMVEAHKAHTAAFHNHTERSEFHRDAAFKSK